MRWNRKHQLGILLTLVLLASAAWKGWKWYDARRVRAELQLAARDYEQGRFHRARARLLPLVGRSGFDASVSYNLGLCEEALGRGQAALDAWARIPASAAEAPPARLAAGRVAMNLGRYTLAEDSLRPLVSDTSPLQSQARQALELLYRLEGRTNEVRDLIARSWVESDDPGLLLGRLFVLEHGAFPLVYVRDALRAGDPSDDRVWLAKAALDAWLGRNEDAARLLDQCLAKRPDDAPVWRAKLLLAVASGALETFREAARRLPPSALTPLEYDRVRVWLAGRIGDPALERAALEDVVKRSPRAFAAWDRLAELATRDRDPARAETYRSARARFNLVAERYRALVGRDSRSNHAQELAEHARQLGMELESRGWAMIAAGRADGSPLLEAAQEQQGTLADVLSAAGLDRLATQHPRPATAAPHAIRMVDTASAAGLAFLHDNGQVGKRNPPPPEPMCGGVAILDYDGDSRMDIYAVQAGAFPPPAGAQPQGDRLYRNLGGGRFRDVTAEAGLAALPGGYGHGATVGDYDGDGRPDLFISRWRSYALYRNTGGRFEDVTTAAGLGGDRDWPTSAAFADLDDDGDLDLYVCHYLAYDPSNPKRCTHPEDPSNHQCNPRDFPALADHVFRNDRGRFVDVTRAAGFVDPDGRGLGVLAAHLDSDDRIDIYVANDMSANYLFRNLGGFRFEERGVLAGAAVSGDGGFKAGMGIASGDLDGDGLIDLAVTNYFGESTTFFRNLGDGYFADDSAAIGIAAPTRSLLGFGIAFLDADNDGWLDVLSVNGHVLDARPRFPWMMPIQLLQGSPGGRLRDVSGQAGDLFQKNHLGRGLAIGDLDDDGRLDAVALCQNEPLVLLANKTVQAGRSISIQLEGTQSNRDAIGARLKLHAGGRAQVAERSSGGSYQSSSDPRIVFGLGTGEQVDELEIRWPSGKVDRYERLESGHRYRIREGDPRPADLGPFAKPVN